MVFNEMVRWQAEDLEALTEAQTACMKMFEKTGNFDWVGTAARLQRKAEDVRHATLVVVGWYLV